MRNEKREKSHKEGWGGGDLKRWRNGETGEEK